MKAAVDRYVTRHRKRKNLNRFFGFGGGESSTLGAWSANERRKDCWKVGRERRVDCLDIRVEGRILRVEVVDSDREAARQEKDRCDAVVVKRRGSLPAMVIVMMTAAEDSGRGIEKMESLWRDHECRVWRWREGWRRKKK